MFYPSLEEVKGLGKAYNKVPIGLEVYMDFKTPMGLLYEIKQVSDAYFLFESIEGGEKIARYTFLGSNPAKVFRCKEGVSTLEDKAGKVIIKEKPHAIIQKLLKAHHTPSIKGLPSFTGGAVGYFGYESVQYVQPIKFTNTDHLEVPDILLMFFDELIAFDHVKQKIFLIAHVDTTKRDIEEAYQEAVAKIEALYAISFKQNPMPQAPPIEPIVCKPLLAKEEHIRRVEKIKEYIKQGDIFQAVLSQRFAFTMKEDLFHVYRVLRCVNPSPYMYMMKCKDIEIAGASPETLVKVVKGKVTSMPIAGTKRRGKDEEEDKALEKVLLEDEKERAEHNMLVDLARNDVGMVSAFDTVKVKDYMYIKRFSHVMHIASEVEGILREDLDAIDALKYILPAGTLSGAPKLRAMEIIEELEDTRRGVYGGAIGYMGYDGSLDTCIAIRTIVKKGDKGYIQTGGGIVLDSKGEEEYEETYNKARALFEAIEKVREMR